MKNNAIRFRRWAALALCGVLMLLTACSGEVPTAQQPVTAAGGKTVPCIDNTVKHNGKTLYQYYSLNPDTIGWLKIDGIKTDNVVMLGQEKEYAGDRNTVHHYLHYNFDHKWSSAGELYMDYRCRVTYDSMTQNMTIYGHHMKNGTMLAGLDSYTRKAYFEKHQYMEFSTLWNTCHFRVFGVFVVNLKVARDRDFNYRRPNFNGDEDFLSFIDEVKRRSKYDTGVEVKGDDRILTLSTCTYPTGHPETDDARLVVMARKCTPEEEAQLAGK